MKLNLIKYCSVLAVALVGVSCGTITGMGQDLKKAGSAVNNRIKTGAWGSSAPAYQTPNYQAPGYQLPEYQPPGYEIPR